MSQQIDINAIAIQPTLTVAEVNLLLDGLGALPFNKVERLYVRLRQHALDAINATQKALMDEAAAQKSREPAVVSDAAEVGPGPGPAPEVAEPVAVEGATVAAVVDD